jgi:hypothetical protein
MWLNELLDSASFEPMEPRAATVTPSRQSGLAGSAPQLANQTSKTLPNKRTIGR